MRVVVRIDHTRSPVKVTPEQKSDIRKCVNRCLRSRAIRDSGGPVAGLLSSSDTLEVGVAIVADGDIRSLNRQYRGIDADTDVLSFWHDLDTDEVQRLRESGDPLPLGDIVISSERAAEQAARCEHSVRREMAYLTVHGVLHLLGFDHEEEAARLLMRWAEEEVLSGIGICREPEEPE